MGYTDFRLNGLFQVTSASKSFWSVLTSKWWRSQAINGLLLSTLNWIIYYVDDRFHILTSFMIFVNIALMVLKIWNEGDLFL